MNLRTLPKLPVIGYRKDGRAIFPIMGGEDSPTAEQQAAAAAAQQQAAADAAKNTGPVEATDEHGIGLGFPKDTAVADMKNDAERAAYWRNQSKVQQAKVPSNLADLQSAAEKWQQYQQSQQTPSEQAIQKARDEAIATARVDASKEAAVALLRVSLHTAGKNEQEIDELVEFVDPARFLNAEKKLDATKVTSYLAKIVPAGSAGGQGGIPGQGRYEQQQSDKAAAGRAEAEKRGYKPADRSQSSLIPR